MPPIKEINLVIVGKRLKSVRQSQKMSLKELADQTGVSFVALSNLETGKGLSYQVLFTVMNFYYKKKIQIYQVFALDYNEEYLMESGSSSMISNQISRRLNMINTEFSKEIILLKDFVRRNIEKKKK